MGSPHIEWTKFAESQGWNPQRSRSDYPVSQWVDEKKRIIARKQGEKLAEMLFSHEFKWHKQVLNTLHKYPASIDQLFELINKRVRDLAALDSIADVPTGELVMLTKALKNVTEAKYASLLIDRWSFELAEKQTATESPESSSKGGGFQIEIMGMGQVSMADIQQMMTEYLDQGHPDIGQVKN